MLLRFGRTGSRDNTITLRCVDDMDTLRIPIRNANFFVRAPSSSSRQSVPDEERNGVIMFLLTPETEGYFSCQNQSTPNVFSEELLLAGEEE